VAQRAFLALVLAAFLPGALSAQQWTILEPTAQGPLVLSSGTTGAAQLSGITWVGGAQFYAVGDNDPIVYPLEVVIDPSNGVITDAALSPGLSLAAGDDLEGVAYDAVAGTLMVSDESGPAIRAHDPSDGALLQTLTVPLIFAAHRPNLSLESLSLAPDGTSLWTANEEALAVDGPVSSTSAGTIVRLQRFDAAFAADGQWAYVTDPLPGDIGLPGRDIEVSGVVDLAALDDGRLLVLERALGPTGFRHRLYEVDVSGATDVSAIADLSSASFTPAARFLHWDRLSGFNYEGLSLGPPLANGLRSVMLVADNGGGATQAVRNLLLEPIRPVCSPQPLSGCLAAGASKLAVLSHGGARDRLVWSWRKGNLADATALLGDAYLAFGTLGFALCVYDTNAGVPQLRIAAAIPRGDDLWRTADAAGATYVDRDGTAAGVRKIVLRAGSGDAVMRLRASGAALAVPAPGPQTLLGRDPEVTVQFVNRAAPDACLTASFSDAGRELPDRFAAKF
jgi:hypothetical protein